MNALFGRSTRPSLNHDDEQVACVITAHLIRRKPPICMGMDLASVDKGVTTGPGKANKDTSQQQQQQQKKEKTPPPPQPQPPPPSPSQLDSSTPERLKHRT
ncbi:hypothetical protein RUM43_007334 [Polyplax serrata]|uniref:Uncharacterized protein n=1 Tax=Polyplax serrata TaxID=468196 RepID=A0AAN8S8M5_POLSC